MYHDHIVIKLEHRIERIIHIQGQYTRKRWMSIQLQCIILHHPMQCFSVHASACIMIALIKRVDACRVRTCAIRDE
jgi:hypothetical protein